MTAPDSFDPFSAPAPDDLPARATRLATACAVVSMLAANPPSPSHLALLPHDHLAVVLSRTGSLAVRAVAEPAPSAQATAFMATVRHLLTPLLPAISQVLRAQAATHLFHGVASLLDGIAAEASSLAEAVQARGLQVQ